MFLALTDLQNDQDRGARRRPLGATSRQQGWASRRLRPQGRVKRVATKFPWGCIEDDARTARP